MEDTVISDSEIGAVEAIEILRLFQENVVCNVGGKENTPYRVYQRAIESLEREIGNN